MIFVLSKEHEQVCSDGEGGGESRLGQDGDGAPVFHHQGCEQRSHLPNAKHFLQIQTKKVKSSLQISELFVLILSLNRPIIRFLESQIWFYSILTHTLPGRIYQYPIFIVKIKITVI